MGDLQLADSFGDGWNGNSLTLTDCAGAQLTEEASYTIDWGDGTVHDVCIASAALDAGFLISVGGGNWQSEISWDLIDADAVVILSGVAGDYNEGCPVGCTDTTATNYDADAAVDDGSCEFPNLCEGDALDLHLADSWGDGWNGNSLTLTDCDGAPLTDEASYTLDAGDVFIHDVCIASAALEAGFLISAGGGNWASEISWDLIDADGVVVMSGVAGDYNEGCPVENVCDGDSLDLQLADSFGDGWNGNSLTLTDCAGAQLTEEASYTIDWGDGTVHDVCIASAALDAGFLISVGGGNWQSEISWDLIDADAVVILSGVAGDYNEGCPVGCTDTTATNYD